MLENERINDIGYRYFGVADRARYFKEDKKGEKIMSNIVEEIVNYEKIEAAKRMHSIISLCWKGEK